MKARTLALIDAEIAKAQADLDRHRANTRDYLAREDWHGVWDFGVECQNARDVLRAMQRLRAGVEALTP